MGILIGRVEHELRRLVGPMSTIGIAQFLRSKKETIESISDTYLDEFIEHGVDGVLMAQELAEETRVDRGRGYGLFTLEHIEAADLAQLGIAGKFAAQALHARVLEYDAGDNAVPHRAHGIIVGKLVGIVSRE